MTNLQKYILGLNPLVKAAGVPPVTIGKNVSGQTTVQFPTIADRFYRIYYSGTVGGSWTQAGGAFVGTGANVTWTDDGSQTGGAPSSVPRRFYRVQIGLQ